MLLDPLPMGGHKVMHAAQQDCEPIPGNQRHPYGALWQPPTECW